MPLVTHFEADAGHAAPAPVRPHVPLPRARRGSRRQLGAARKRSIPRPRHARRTRGARWDPVPSPAVVPRRQFTEGESLMRMVIRSTLGELPARLRAARPHRRARRSHRRRPRVPRRERPPRRAAARSRSSSRSGTRSSTPRSASRPDRPNLERAVRHRGARIRFVPAAGPERLRRQPADPDARDRRSRPAWKKGTPLAVRRVRVPRRRRACVCRTCPTRCRWARRSRRCRVHRAPGCSSGNRPARTHRGTTGDRSACRIEDGAGAPVYDATQAPAHRAAAAGRDGDRQPVVVPRPKATAGAVRSVDDRSAASSAAAPNAEPRPGQGAHWMLTPWQRAHAGARGREAARAAGDRRARQSACRTPACSATSARRSRCSRASCRTMPRAPVDSTSRRSGPNRSTTCSQDAPRRPRRAHAHVGDFQLQASEDACRIDRDDAPASGAQPPRHQLRHEFKDTKHRYVTYQATATTRFREYFPPAITDDRDADHAHRSRGASSNVPSSRRPDPPRRARTSSRRGRSRTDRSAASPSDRVQRLASTASCAPAPAAVCVSTWTARGGHRVSTSCSASCSSTSPGSRGRSTSRPGSTCRQWPRPPPRSSRSGRSTSNSWSRRAR